MTCEFTNFKCLFQWTNRAFWVKQVVFSPGPQLDLGLLQVGSELLYFFSQIQSWDLGSDLDIWFPLAPDWSWCRSSAHIWPIDNSSLGNLNFKLGSESPTYCIRQGKGKFPPTHVLLWEQAFILSPKARLPPWISSVPPWQLMTKHPFEQTGECRSVGENHPYFILRDPISSAEEPKPWSIF